MPQSMREYRALHIDYAKPVKEALLRGEQVARGNSHASKLEAAIDWLGKKYVLHAVNRVRKLPEPLPDVFQWSPRILKSRK